MVISSRPSLNQVSSSDMSRCLIAISNRTIILRQNFNRPSVRLYHHQKPHKPMANMSAAQATRAVARRFAPLDPEVQNQSEMVLLPKLDGIIFDVDGTLCEPQTYMFAEMRSVLGIDKGIDILDHIYSLSDPQQQEAAMESIRAIERRAMTEQKPQPGLKVLMDYLSSRGTKKAICTRNFDLPVNHLLETFADGHEFHPIITREFRPPKPSPAGILHIATSWSLPSADNLIMVGDSMDDMTAGRRAGAATVLLVNPVNEDLANQEFTDRSIRRLDELVHVLERGF